MDNLRVMEQGGETVQVVCAKFECERNVHQERGGKWKGHKIWKVVRKGFVVM